jgi:hypothetical protein
MMEQIRSKMQDDGIKTAEGKPNTGGSSSADTFSTVVQRISSMVGLPRMLVSFPRPVIMSL